LADWDGTSWEPSFGSPLEGSISKSYLRKGEGSKSEAVQPLSTPCTNRSSSTPSTRLPHNPQHPVKKMEEFRLPPSPP